MSGNRYKMNKQFWCSRPRYRFSQTRTRVVSNTTSQGLYRTGVKAYSVGFGLDLGFRSGTSISPDDPYTLQDAMNSVMKYWSK